ncbi:MAG: FAD-dependent oxidoreductase [Deinococcales bacterium]
MKLLRPISSLAKLPSLRRLAAYGFKHGLKSHPQLKLHQLISKYSQSPILKPFFLRFATYFGANPYLAPAVLHNIAWVELGLGAFYPKGGIKGVIHALQKLAESLGVGIHTATKVEALELKGRKVSQVHSSKGSFQADAIIIAWTSYALKNF